MSILPVSDLPDGVRLGDARLIQPTGHALAKIRDLRARESEEKPYLRVGVSGGGCNGLSYRMRFVEAPRKGDILLVFDDVSILVDSKSALYLKGMSLDYSHQLISGGFKFSNPNAKASCSCGESFSI